MSTTSSAQSGSGTSEKMGQAKDKAQEKAGQVQEKAGQAQQKATQATDKGLDKATEGLDKLSSTLHDRAENDQRVPGQAGMVADKLDATTEYLRGKDTDQLVNDLEALVRRKPVESVAGAVAIGFVLAKILR